MPHTHTHTQVSHHFGGIGSSVGVFRFPLVFFERKLLKTCILHKDYCRYFKGNVFLFAVDLAVFFNLILLLDVGGPKI